MPIVTVPHIEYREGSEANTFWHGTGGWFTAMERVVGEEMAFTIILSRIGHELRKRHGIEDAKQVFRVMAATMDEAAKADL